MPQQIWVKVQADGEEYGPYTGQQLKEYIAAGRITAASLVSLDHATWHPARRIKGLFPAEGAATLQPAQPAGRAAAAVRTAPRPPAAPAHGAASAAHSPAMQVPPAQISPIAYRSTMTQGGLTPDEQFRGVFLMLYITALLLGLLFLLSGIVLALAALQVTGSRAGQMSYLRLALPGVMLLSGVFLAGAGFLGLIRKSAEGLLFIGALIFAIMRVIGAVMELYPDSASGLVIRRTSWGYISEIQRLILAVIFPVLCFAGIAAVRRARQSPAEVSSRSPWTPLARAIGMIAVVAGAFMLVRYGRVAVNLSGPVKIPGAQAASIRSEALLRTALALLMSAGMVAGGALTLVGNLAGRIIVLVSSTGLLLYAIYLAARYIGQVNATTMGDRLADVTPLFFFVLFAAIVLLRGGLSKSRLANPRSTAPPNPGP